MVFFLKHLASRVLHAYADYRVGASTAEKRCYKQTDSVLLTFDDYGSEVEVEEILTILSKEHVKAMFFLQGDWAIAHEQLVQRIRAAGHVIGNHTVSHAVLRGLPVERIKAEIEGGLPAPWFRPPQGRYDNQVRDIAAQLGYVICYWSIDSRDWTGASVEEMRHTILSELHPGAVVLFHLHGKFTRDVLPGLIQDIRGHGYQLTEPEENWSPTV